MEISFQELITTHRGDSNAFLSICPSRSHSCLDIRLQTNVDIFWCPSRFHFCFFRIFCLICSKCWARKQNWEILQFLLCWLYILLFYPFCFHYLQGSLSWQCKIVSFKIFLKFPSQTLCRKQGNFELYPQNLFPILLHRCVCVSVLFSVLILQSNSEKPAYFSIYKWNHFGEI